MAQLGLGVHGMSEAARLQLRYAVGFSPAVEKYILKFK